MVQKRILDTGWKFKIAPEYENHYPEYKKWRPASVPGTIHTDLLNNDLIPDPFFGENELQLQWISDVNWQYRLQFTTGSEFRPDIPLYLVCDGVDTITDIYLNDVRTGFTDNMFRRFRFDISRLVNDEENILDFHFTSARKYAGDMMKQHGNIFSVRKAERSYIRKAQYSFGWDWGPAFPTMGIWRDIYLWQPDHYWIEYVGFNTLSLDPERADVQVGISVDGYARSDACIKICLSNADATYERRITIGNSGHYVVDITIERPELWWPNGSGPQALYDLKIELFDTDDHLLDQKDRKVGIRKLELTENQNGEPAFCFRINDRPVFMRGANWIPADSFIPRISSEKYNELLTSARDANMNMLRVWGGGIYENPVFYELCDRLGLLVWQDFMFACAAYPEHQDFLENVDLEIRHVVSELQYHPSIAIWCGNNENEWIWYRENQGSYEDMPGYKLFHRIIPGLVGKIDPLRKYWPTSPFGDDEDPNDPRSGNRHQWDIWSRWVDYEEVVQDKSLFVTEFGFQGPANLSAFERALPENARKPGHRIFEFHNKQIEGNERIFRFLAGHLPVRTGWEDFIYLTQLNQALALKCCLEHWRGRWPETAGALIWQLNDCWPVTSWSLIDGSLLPKIAYHFVKQAFAPLHVQLSESKHNLAVLIINDTSSAFGGTLQIDVVDLEAGICDYTRLITFFMGASSRITLPDLFNPNLSDIPGRAIVLSLRDENDELLSRNFHLPSRWKYQTLAKADLRAEQIKDKDGYVLAVTAGRTAFFVDLLPADMMVNPRGFILLPGEKREIALPGAIASDQIKIFCLNDYLS